MRRISVVIIPRLVGFFLGALVLGYAVLTQFNEDGLGRALDAPVYYGLLVAAAAFTLSRAVARAEQRVAWLLVGLALASWASGDLYYLYGLETKNAYPSFADALWLACYPLLFVGLGLLLRGRTHKINRSFWLDGVIAGLTVAALGAAFVFDTVVDTTGGASLPVATNLAYPLGDLGLLLVVLSTLALTGWELDRVWGFVLAGCVVFAVSDSVYLFQVAQGTYVEGALLDAGWPLALTLFALGAWQPRRPVLHRRLEGFRMLVVPVVAGLVSLSLLVVDHYEQLNQAALVFATLAVTAVIGRMALTFRENVQLLAQSRYEAETDALTGLANRRKLVFDLQDRLDAGAPTLLGLFDLDGFKSYNDAYGHPAGDALLRRFAQKLSAAVAGHGDAYRMGGDEFCVLVDLEAAERRAILGAASQALVEEGEGFRITSALGSVLLPQETTNASDALRLVDSRMYENKDSRRGSAVRQSTDVLVSVLNERDGALRRHLTSVAELARSVGSRLGLRPDELRDLDVTAELHDVGKLAVPDSILSKSGPLSEEEWRFIFRHTLIGERILGSAPSLARIGPLVRATHERIDGQGYPDGLAGPEIPRLSRIVAACDAYVAMIRDRPYRPARTPAEAIAELRRCAGTQFDPDVVDVLVRVLEEVSLSRVA